MFKHAEYTVTVLVMSELWNGFSKTQLPRPAAPYIRYTRSGSCPAKKPSLQLTCHASHTRKPVRHFRHGIRASSSSGREVWKSPSCALTCANSIDLAAGGWPCLKYIQHPPKIVEDHKSQENTGASKVPSDENVLGELQPAHCTITQRLLLVPRV